MRRNTQKEVLIMKCFILFAIAAFLIALPLSAMGVNSEKVNKSAGLGLAGGQISGDAFAFNHGFSNIKSVAAPLLMPGHVRPPFYAGGPTPSWWKPLPERPPWYASPSH